MGIVTFPKPAKLIAGVLLSNPDETKAPLFQRLERRFGPMDRVSEQSKFDKTTYYDQEMGHPLYRVFVSFRALVAPDTLPDIKLATNQMETSFPNETGGRRVNVDPGILTLQNLILSTTKNYTHRIYLGKGIYGDLTLIFQKGQYLPLPWTYPDYKDDMTRRFFFDVRETYKTQLKELEP